jgi:hypothetical protein
MILRGADALFASGSIAKDVNVIGALAMLSADGNG